MAATGVILSMEQALSMTYATMRFAQLGWRVIRVEATASRPGALPGDPNRYIGDVIADGDRRSYFVAPNVGKEAIALNLKSAAGQAALKRIIRELKVDVFCCNTLPLRYQPLGIDYETLSQVKPDLIWAGISAGGPDFPEMAGYDPAIQAMSGFMEVTGMADGPPTLAGIPVIDLKAGDEVYANIWKAMLEREQSGRGQRIDVSMLQAAASWLITVLPLVDLGCTPDEITRAGNEHRKFVPTNAYPTKDGAILMAIGSDAQFHRLCEIPKFAGLDREDRRVNAGRLADRVALHREIARVTAQYRSDELTADYVKALIPHAPILNIPQVMELPGIKDKLTRTRLPDGRVVRMPPMARDDPDAPGEYDFPSNYGQHTEAVLREAGLSAGEIKEMIETGAAATGI